MPLGTHDMQATDGFYALAKLDVGTAPGHVGSDSHSTLLPGTSDDLGLLLVVFCVENAMDDAVFLEHSRDQLADLHRDGADEDRAALPVNILNLV